MASKRAFFHQTSFPIGESGTIGNIYEFYRLNYPNNSSLVLVDGIKGQRFTKRGFVPDSDQSQTSLLYVDAAAIFYKEKQQPLYPGTSQGNGRFIERSIQPLINAYRKTTEAIRRVSDSDVQQIIQHFQETDEGLQRMLKGSSLQFKGGFMGQRFEVPLSSEESVVFSLSELQTLRSIEREGKLKVIDEQLDSFVQHTETTAHQIRGDGRIVAEWSLYYFTPKPPLMEGVPSQIEG